MNNETILVVIYIAIGIILMLYWNEKDYAKDYEESKKEGKVEKGMMDMLLLFLVFFWPLKLIYNIIKKKRI